MAGIQETLKNIYFNPKDPNGFGGRTALAKSVKGLFKEKDVYHWLDGQDTYTLHKPIIKKFKRNKYVTYAIDELWQADLVDMKHLNKYNDGFNYILTVIDVFSKYAWCKSLKTKKSIEIKNAFKDIFKSRKPSNLQTDKGKEFVSKIFKKFLSSHNVNFFVANNPDVKAAVIERFNKTLKTRMQKYLTYAKTFKYIDVLNDLVYSYNHRFHSTIKMAPFEVNQYNSLLLRDSANNKPKKPKLKRGQYVRITRYKHIFEKGYEINWSREIFKIKNVQKRLLPVYEIEDLAGEPIEGTFYEKELQVVSFNPNDDFKIEKIIKKRGDKVLVKWLGYPDKFNSWVSRSSIIVD